MKQFFSIKIHHDYEKNDSSWKASEDLSIIPARTSANYVKNNRLLFHEQPGLLDCYIEDDESLKKEIDILFFWVVCTNDNFYNYTEYPMKINFSAPYYYWSNTKDTESLQEPYLCDLHPGSPPKKGIGCIGILINKIEAYKSFNINFNVRKTYWVYNVYYKENQENWSYRIEDIIDEIDISNKNKKWAFEEVAKNKERIIFQSTEPIPYSKKATDRFRLNWDDSQKGPFKHEEKMTLPYPNCAYKMVNEDNKELTPVYIYI